MCCLSLNLQYFGENKSTLEAEGYRLLFKYPNHVHLLCTRAGKIKPKNLQVWFLSVFVRKTNIWGWIWMKSGIIHSIHSLKKNYCRVKTKSPAPSCYNKDCHSKALQTVFIAKCGKSYRRDFFQYLHHGENIQRRETGFLVEKAKVQYLSMWKQLKNKKGKQSLPYSKSRLDDR